MTGQPRELKWIPLGRLEPSVEPGPAGRRKNDDAALKESLKQHGILVPLLVRPGDQGSYRVLDGGRRLRSLREIGKDPGFVVPAMVADDLQDDDTLARLAANRYHARLSTLAEALVLRQLVEERGWKRAHAARALLKTRSWATHTMRVWRLPEPVMEDVLNGTIPFAHAMVLARYLDQPAILDLLVDTIRASERVSRRRLEALAHAAEVHGVEEATRFVPERRAAGASSWVRIELAPGAVRAELKVGSPADLDAVLRVLAEELHAAVTHSRPDWHAS